MKILSLGLFVALVQFGVMAAFLAVGLAIGRRRSWREELADRGLTRRSADLYPQLVEFVTRLAAQSETDAMMSGDHLSAQTRETAQRLVAAHKEGLRQR